MANFSRKVVLVLLLFCLSLTYIRCRTVESINLARVEDPKVPDSSCGAVWIGKNTLLTAASCFDQEGKIDFSKHKDAEKNTVRDVTIEICCQNNRDNQNNPVWGKVKDEKGVEVEGKKKIKGKALIHPLFKRNNDERKMPLAYDLAVVVVADLGKHLGRKENAKVCSGNYSYKDPRKKKDLKKWIAAVAEEDFVKEWELEKMTLKKQVVAIISASASDEMGEWYIIDPELQFTTELDIAQEMRKNIFIPFTEKEKEEINTPDQLTAMLRKYAIIHPGRYGSPILDRTTGCVAGIISFAGQEVGKQYLTSTKLVPVSNWIKQTQRFFDLEFGPRKSALKGMKREIDLIRPRKFRHQPGTTEENAMLAALDELIQQDMA